MTASNISYPHPVLGNGDDVAVGEISPAVSFEISDEAILLSVENLSSNHSNIDNMLADGDAVWHLLVQCSRTYMRESFVATGSDFAVSLKGEDYEGIVTVDITIIANGNIEKYSPEGLHTDYEGEEFKLRAGEVLGIGPTFRFHVDKVYDPLRAPVASLVRITEGDHKEGPFLLTLDDELIIIRLSKVDWHEYAGIRDRLPTVVHAAIVLPALADAILQVGNYTDTLWGGRLKDLLEANNISVAGSPLAAAQEILASPVSRTFREVNAVLDRGEY